MATLLHTDLTFVRRIICVFALLPSRCVCDCESFFLIMSCHGGLQGLCEMGLSFFNLIDKIRR